LMGPSTYVQKSKNNEMKRRSALDLVNTGLLYHIHQSRVAAW
jgi:hypothetical protein